MTHLTFWTRTHRSGVYNHLTAQPISCKGMEIAITEISFRSKDFQPYIVVKPQTWMNHEMTKFRDSDFYWFYVPQPDSHHNHLERKIGMRGLYHWHRRGENGGVLLLPTGRYFDWKDMIPHMSKHFHGDIIATGPNSFEILPKSGRKFVLEKPFLGGMFRYEVKGPGTPAGKTILKLTPDEKLTRKSNFIFIYCNIIQPQRVGDSYAQLLRVIPIHTTWEEIQNDIFKRPIYVPTCVNSFQSIELTFRDEYGRKLQGTFLCHLHLRYGQLFDA